MFCFCCLFYWSMKTSLVIILSIQDNSSPHIANCKVNAVSRSYWSTGIGTCSSPFGSEFCWLLLVPAGRSYHTVWRCHTVWRRRRSNLGGVQSHRLSRLREATLTYIGWLISLLWRQFVGVRNCRFFNKIRADETIQSLRLVQQAPLRFSNQMLLAIWISLSIRRVRTGRWLQ